MALEVIRFQIPYGTYLVKRLVITFFLIVTIAIQKFSTSGSTITSALKKKDLIGSIDGNYLCEIMIFSQHMSLIGFEKHILYVNHEYFKM